MEVQETVDWWGGARPSIYLYRRGDLHTFIEIYGNTAATLDISYSNCHNHHPTWSLVGMWVRIPLKEPLSLFSVSGKVVPHLVPNCRSESAFSINEPSCDVRSSVCASSGNSESMLLWVQRRSGAFILCSISSLPPVSHLCCNGGTPTETDSYSTYQTHTCMYIHVLTHM